MTHITDDLDDPIDALLALTGDPHVQVSIGVGCTEYLITGSLPAIYRQISKAFEMWPADGYGTCVHGISKAFGDDYTCRISHSNSCD